MFKTTIKTLCKIFISGIIALVPLTLLCCFYSNHPRYNINGPGNVFYFLAGEGFGWGRTNNEGYTNMFDFDDGTKIDVLITGSSHMEAYQVDMRLSTASRLNALLENETVYNIGVSGQYFLNCARNLNAALKKYQPTKYVVIETGNISFSDEEISPIISEKAEEAVEPQFIDNGGEIRGLYRSMRHVILGNPYLWLINQRKVTYNAKLQAENKEKAVGPEAPAEPNIANNENLLNALLHKMSASAE